MLNNIKEVIHKICTKQTDIYSSLFCCIEDSDIIKYIDFNFAFTITENVDFETDMKIFLNNIISKIFEINFNIDYHKEKLGGSVTTSNIKTEIYSLTRNYIIEDEYRILDLENYINDLKIEHNINDYRLNIKIPIYKLNTDKIEII